MKSLTIPVTYRGRTYDFVGSPSRVLQALMTPEAWAKFRATKPTVRDCRGLLAAFGSQLPRGRR